MSTVMSPYGAARRRGSPSTVALLPRRWRCDMLMDVTTRHGRPWAGRNTRGSAVGMCLAGRCVASTHFRPQAVRTAMLKRLVAADAHNGARSRRESTRRA